MTYVVWSVTFGEQPTAAKWNQLGTNDAHFYSFLGDNLAWQTWTPALTNLSGGTQTYAKYIQIGKTVHFRFKYTLAGDGVSGEIKFTPPTTLGTGYAAEDYLDASGLFVDTGSAAYTGVVRVETTSLLTIRCIHTDGSRATNQPASSTNPFTFGSGDVIEAHGSYEAA